MATSSTSRWSSTPSRPTDLDGRASGEAVSRLKRSARAPGLQTEGCLPPGPGWRARRALRRPRRSTAFDVGLGLPTRCGDAPHWASWSRSDEISWSTVCAAHRVIHRVRVMRDLRHGSGRGQGGVLQSRVHSLHIGQALLEPTDLLRELAQLLGECLVVIHRADAWSFGGASEEVPVRENGAGVCRRSRRSLTSRLTWPAAQAAKLAEPRTCSSTFPTSHSNRWAGEAPS